jgi:hypothetical protein
MTNILQKPIFTDFLYPFLLMFFLIFGILEKTKLFGADKKTQLNALVALVISLIFVSAIFPKIVVGNLMLFLAIALVVLFVGLLLWGFVSGGEAKIDGKMKIFFGVLIFVAVLLALIWATGFGGGLQNIFNWMFNSKWSNPFWTNFIIVVLVIGAVALVIKFKPK